MSSPPRTPPPAAGAAAFLKHYRGNKPPYPNNDFGGKVPPLYPRKDFFRLSFPSDVSTRQRIDWKNRYQQSLQQDVGIPTRNLAALTNIFVKRSNTLMISQLQQGNYGGINFVSSDEPPRNSANKYRHFILKGFPKDEEFKEFNQNLGSELTKHVFKLFRIKRDGRPTTSVKIIWKSHDEDPPKRLPLYKDMPESPDMSIEEVDPLPPTCNICNKVGHFKKSCWKKNGIDSLPHGDTEIRRERNISSVPERNRTVTSGDLWMQEGPNRGTTFQQVSKEGEGSDHQQKYNEILQENKAMREEINSLRVEKDEINEMKEEINSMREEIKRQQEIINMMMNWSSPSLLEDSDNDHPLIATDPVVDSLVDGLHKNDSGEKEEDENEDYKKKGASVIMEDVGNESGNDGAKQSVEKNDDKNESDCDIKLGESMIKDVPLAGKKNKNEVRDEISLQGDSQPSPVATRSRRKEI